MPQNTKTNVDKTRFRKTKETKCAKNNKTQFEERNGNWIWERDRKLRRGIEGGRVRLNSWWRGARTRRGWWAGRRSSSRSASDPLAASFQRTDPFSREWIFGSRSQKTVLFSSVSELCGAMLCLNLIRVRLGFVKLEHSASVSLPQLPLENSHYSHGISFTETNYFHIASASAFCGWISFYPHDMCLLCDAVFGQIKFLR